MQNQNKVLKDQKKIQFVKEVKGMYGKEFYLYEEPDRTVIALTPEEIKVYKKKKENVDKNQSKVNFAMLKIQNQPIKLTKTQIRILERMNDQDDKQSIRSYFQTESMLSRNSCRKCKQKTSQIKRLQVIIKEQDQQKQIMKAAYQQNVKVLKLRLNQKKQSSESFKSIDNSSEDSTVLKICQSTSFLKRSGSHAQIKQKAQNQDLSMSVCYSTHYWQGKLG